MLVMRLIRRAATVALIVFSTGAIVFISGLAAWIWLVFGPGPG